MCSYHGPCLHVLPRSALLGAQQRASRVRGPISLLRVKIHRERSTERAQGQRGISEVSRTGAFPSSGPGGCLCWGGGQWFIWHLKTMSPSSPPNPHLVLPMDFLLWLTQRSKKLPFLFPALHHPEPIINQDLSHPF